jgi:hypothetical protein
MMTFNHSTRERPGLAWSGHGSDRARRRWERLMKRTTLTLWVAATLALPTLGGCGIQDPGQPAMHSITPRARSDEPTKLPRRPVKKPRASRSR